MISLFILASNGKNYNIKLIQMRKTVNQIILSG